MYVIIYLISYKINIINKIFKSNIKKYSDADTFIIL